MSRPHGVRSSIELDRIADGLPGWRVVVKLPGFAKPVKRRFAFTHTAQQEENARARAEGWRDGVIAAWQQGAGL